MFVVFHIDDFYVTMGDFNGAEVCELVGIYLLSQLKDALYRNHGLAMFIYISGPQSEKLKKQFQKEFRER